ncbi:hypothetical protein J7M22_10740 [Candidatus Poribacteria bacterium]|nr:hypothetical protein [Candidatus Poribacteria bacterium]
MIQIPNSGPNLRTDEPFFKRLAHARKIISPFCKGFPVDVIVLTPEELEELLKANDPFLGGIIRKGKVLYDECNK